MADSAPKSLAPSVLAHSSSGSSIGSAEYRPTKSIIVGGGQPIVIPGQLNITNDVKLRKQLSEPAAAPTQIESPAIVPAKSAQGFIASLFGKNDVQEAVVPTARMTIAEQRIESVEEFCPDGETLDKGFLDHDEHQQGGGGGGGQIDQDSDRFVFNCFFLVSKF